VLRLLVALGLIVVAVAVVVSVVRSRAPEQDSVSRPPSQGVLTLPVKPVGGDLGGTRQTLASALTAVEDAAEYGAGGIQMTADIHWLCRTRECDTAPLEPVVTRARELGLRVYLHVNSTPEWMDARGRWYAPEGAAVETWADLFAQIVERFGTTVTGYEVWNEPNYDAFWRQGPDAGAYADLLKAVWTAVQDRNPEVRLVGGMLSNNDLGYMQELSAALKERGGNAENRFFYDELGVHPYSGAEGVGFDPAMPAGSADVQVATGPKDMTFLGVERLRNQVAADEGIWRSVVIGEFGYDTTPGAWYHAPEPLRAEYMAAALRRASDWDWLLTFTPYTYTPEADDGFAIRGTATDTALRQVAAALWE
jgi:hypothetical protein